MRPPFEQWASQEIAKLRLEADALQRALDRYLAETMPAAGGDKPKPSQSDESKHKPSEAPSGGRPSKHGHILKLVEEAGPGGLSTDEIEDASAKMGHAIKRNSLRSYLWTQRSDGTLIQRNGRHMSSRFEEEGGPKGNTSDPPDFFEGAA